METKVKFLISQYWIDPHKTITKDLTFQCEEVINIEEEPYQGKNLISMETKAKFLISQYWIDPHRNNNKIFDFPVWGSDKYRGGALPG